MGTRRRNATKGNPLDLRVFFRYDSSGNLFEPYEIVKVEILDSDYSTILETITTTTWRSKGYYGINTSDSWNTTVRLAHDKWYYRLEEGGQILQKFEHVNIVEEAQAPGIGEKYITIQDIRDEGILLEDFSDDRVLEIIILAADYIDLMTGRWFEDVLKTMTLDGKGNKLLQLDVPIISITSIVIGTWGSILNDLTPVDDTYYKVYNRIPDDYQNPQIMFYNKVRKGFQNVQIVGHFGYVDVDGNTPQLIKQAMKKLVIGSLPLLSSDASEEQDYKMKLVEEKTDGHSYKLSDLLSEGSLTGDPQVDNIIQSFRRPIRMGSA